LSSKESACERKVRNHTNIALAADRFKVALKLSAFIKVIVWLQAFVTCQAFFTAGLQCFSQSFSPEVRCSYCANFPRLDQLAISFECFLKRTLFVFRVGLVKVDVVRLQARKRLFCRAQNVFS